MSPYGDPERWARGRIIALLPQEFRQRVLVDPVGDVLRLVDPDAADEPSGQLHKLGFLIVILKEHGVRQKA